MGTVVVGVDVGQRRDPTAIAVVEHTPRERAQVTPASRPSSALVLDATVQTEQHYVVRHLEALPLGTLYPVMAARVADVCAVVGRRTGAHPDLFLDATGVGTPILDVLSAAQVPAYLYAVYFTHGDRRVWGTGELHLGKAWLVSHLQALLQSNRLHLPQTREAEALGKELLDYEIRVDEQANDRYGAFKVGAHDDLVTALGLAVQEPPRRWLWYAM